ncbi:DUF1292 domain-containing protein [[Clostridium] colinum]|uniref:DUF1292 domain-containing protein n=1 Tax=[Clostridium] colinum TaxID=36835 RepID=UPI002024084A|nr:DUF1292 domain-containing protein [[Clostridium] colinum]
MQEEFDNILDDMEDTYDVVSIVSENNEVIDCFVIDGVLDNNTQYLLVVSCDDFDKDEAEAFILKQIGEDDEEAIYAPVEDNNEYNRVLILLQENETDYEMEF